MIKHAWIIISTVLIFNFAMSLPYAATVETKHGVREGKVISRKFDETVVTIVTAQKRIFQFPANEIVKISSKENLLIAEATALFEKNSMDSEKINDFAPGTEVEILETPQNSAMIKVKGWGSVEGWILKKALTNEVVFPKEEVKETPAKPVINEPSANVTISEPSLLPAGATVEAASGQIKKVTK